MHAAKAVVIAAALVIMPACTGGNSSNVSTVGFAAPTSTAVQSRSPVSEPAPETALPTSFVNAPHGLPTDVAPVHVKPANADALARQGILVTPLPVGTRFLSADEALATAYGPLGYSEDRNIPSLRLVSMTREQSYHHRAAWMVTLSDRVAVVYPPYDPLDQKQHQSEKAEYELSDVVVFIDARTGNFLIGRSLSRIPTGIEER